MRRVPLLVPFLLLLFLIDSKRLNAQDTTITIVVTAEKSDYRNVPARVAITVPEKLAKFRHAHLSAGGQSFPGQITAPGLASESKSGAKGIARELHFIVPTLNKGESLTLTAKLLEQDNAPDPTGFYWKDEKGEPTELIYSVVGGMQQRPVLHYMHEALDDSSKAARERTYKVFHHLFDPEGKRIVTNGGYADLKPGEERKLLYPHHRGIMFGFNKCTYGEGLKKKADTWHCTGDAYVGHEKTLAKEAGAVLGRHTVQIGWHGEKKQRFVEEERELAAYVLPGGTLVEFASRLQTTDGKVHLDGDPQHAGFQFRASNDVADKTKKDTYYLHPDGKGEMGKERNWPQDKSMVDLPWYAMSFVLDGQRYTAVYLNHPTNPKPTRFSERDYGRFGGYFEYDLTEKTPLVVNYRLWLQKGEMTQEQCRALYDAFANGPKVAVK